MDELGGLSGLPGLPGQERRDRVWPAVVGYGVVCGIVSGGLIAAAGAYRVLLCETDAGLIFAVLAFIAWLVAGFRVGRRSASAGAAALTGLLAGIIGACGGGVVNLWLVNQHAAELAACLTRSGEALSVDQVLSSEPHGILLSAIALPIIGAALGFVGGVVGAGGGGRAATGELTPDDERAKASGYIADASYRGFPYGGPRDRPTARNVEGIPGSSEPRDPAP